MSEGVIYLFEAVDVGQDEDTAAAVAAAACLLPGYGVLERAAVCEARQFVPGCIVSTAACSMLTRPLAGTGVAAESPTITV